MTAVHVGIVVVATAAAVVFPLLVEGGGGPAVGGPLLPLLLPRVARQLEGGDTEGQAKGHHTTRPPTSLLLSPSSQNYFLSWGGGQFPFPPDLYC